MRDTFGLTIDEANVTIAKRLQYTCHGILP